MIEKKVYSISLGSSSRDHRARIDILGQRIYIERIGADGDVEKACALMEKYDGVADAIGLGGIDFYLSIKGDKYPLRDAFKVASRAKKTPVVDGSGLKNASEGKIPALMIEKFKLVPEKTRVFFVCALNRSLLAESMEVAGFDMIFGDFMVATKLALPVRSLAAGKAWARFAVPLATALLPYRYLYPVGRDQNERKERFGEYFRWADIIAGDFNYINRHAPVDLSGKIILTTSVTADNIARLKSRGISGLVTAYPPIGGRAFGANVMEAVLVAVSGRKKKLFPGEYAEIMSKAGIGPHFETIRASERETNNSPCGAQAAHSPDLAVEDEPRDE